MRSHSILLALALVGLWGCQTTPPLSYDELADKAANGETVSPGDLRAAFLRDPELPAKMERLLDLEQQALQIVEDEPLKLGSIGSAILDTYQGSITGHYVMTRFYEHVETPDAAAVHQAWLEQIRADMESAGDGSREHPFLAMTSVEAQMYAISRGLSPVGAIYQTSDEHPFALLIQARPADGPVENLTFDLGGLYQAMRMDFTASTADHAAEGDDDFSPFSVIGYLAKRGDTAAQAAIGAFLASQGRNADAVDWLNASARAGNLVASSVLARLYWEEASTAKDPAAKKQALDEVLENYLHAIALGSTDAMYALAVLYLNNHYGEENRASGVTLLTQAAEANHSDAAMFLAHLNYTGEVVERDLTKARNYYIQASELDNAFARRSYARFLLDRSANQEADPRIIGWLDELASNDDDSEAMLLLGNLYARGVGTPQNFRRAVGWYKDAVKAAPEDASIVNEVAWTLTVSNYDQLQRTRYARSIMDTMMEANDEARERPEYLDTWAAAYAATGDFDRAIELQQQAVAVAEKLEFDSVMDILREHLDAFREGQTITETAP
jgi:TPR repeat protein